MLQIGRWIAEALERRSDDKALNRIRHQVFELAEQFPLYAERRSAAGVAMAR
jgi:glycine hydroxymethyltransferase